MSAVFGFCFVYVCSYLVWINYTASGHYFKGIFDRHAIHVGMSFAFHPSPAFLLDFYWPLILLDSWCGRLLLHVGWVENLTYSKNENHVHQRSPYSSLIRVADFHAHYSIYFFRRDCLTHFWHFTMEADRWQDCRHLIHDHTSSLRCGDRSCADCSRKWQHGMMHTMVKTWVWRYP